MSCAICGENYKASKGEDSPIRGVCAYCAPNLDVADLLDELEAERHRVLDIEAETARKITRYLRSFGEDAVSHAYWFAGKIDDGAWKITPE